MMKVMGESGIEGLRVLRVVDNREAGRGEKRKEERMGEGARRCLI